MILEVNIKNNKTIVEIISDNRIRNISKVYLDTYDNRKNYLSPNDSLHTYLFKGQDIIVEEQAIQSIYNIKSDQINHPRFVGLYILTAVYNDGYIESKIVYDLNELYCIRMDYIKNTCNNCSDIANKRKLTLLMFREMLLRNSIAVNNISDSLDYYKDLFRINCYDNSISSCSNGMCNII